MTDQQHALMSLTDADHAVEIWNQMFPAGLKVYRVDDLGRLHETETTDHAYVMPNGTPVVHCADAGTYKLSRVWPRATLEAFIERLALDELEED